MTRTGAGAGPDQAVAAAISVPKSFCGASRPTPSTTGRPSTARPSCPAYRRRSATGVADAGDQCRRGHHRPLHPPGPQPAHPRLKVRRDAQHHVGAPRDDPLKHTVDGRPAAALCRVARCARSRSAGGTFRLGRPARASSRPGSHSASADSAPARNPCACTTSALAPASSRLSRRTAARSLVRRPGPVGDRDRLKPDLFSLLPAAIPASMASPRRPEHARLQAHPPPRRPGPAWPHAGRSRPQWSRPRSRLAARSCRHLPPHPSYHIAQVTAIKQSHDQEESYPGGDPGEAGDAGVEPVP